MTFLCNGNCALKITIILWVDDGRIWNLPLTKFVAFAYISTVAKESLINTFLTFFKMSSKAQTRTFLKMAKRTLRFNQRVPNITSVVLYRWCLANSYSVAGNIYSLRSYILPARIVYWRKTELAQFTFLGLRNWFLISVLPFFVWIAPFLL